MSPLNHPPARLWRSLEELTETEEFRGWLASQHPILADALALDRRAFLKTFGASVALAGLGACSRPPHSEIVPYVHAPPDQIDALPRFFATTLTRAGHALGVLVENHMGRPTKIEGNPTHPASLGGTDIFAQAAVLQLWDPDRSQTVQYRGTISNWDDFAAALARLITRFKATRGAGLRVLTGTVTSPTLIAQLEALRTRYPEMHWHSYEAMSDANVVEGARLAFGRHMTARLRLEKARVIVSLDADFLSDRAAGVRYARDFASLRSPEMSAGMSRLYVVEPTPSLTGAMADHRLPLDSQQIAVFARRLARRLGFLEDDRDGSLEPAQALWLKSVASDLESHRGAGLIVVGAAQPPWMHLLAHVLNDALGNAGTVVEYIDPPYANPDELSSLSELASAMHSGTVEALLTLDCNPMYDAPADLAFGDALQRVPHLLHLGLYQDETAAVAEWHLPQAHTLETWSDARAFDGTASICQPLIAPLYGGRSAHEVLAILLEDEVQEGRALVRRRWQTDLADEDTWRSALQSGVVANSASPVRKPAINASALARSLPARTSEGSLEVLFRLDPTVDDGRWANNSWLQELPKPLTQLTWGNAALVSPALAAAHGLAAGDVVELTLQGRALRAPIWVMPGQAERSITLHLGYGRRTGGRVADGVGFNAFVLRSSIAPWIASGLRLSKTAAREELAATQHHFKMDGGDFVRVGTLAEFDQDPHSVVHRESPLPSLYREYPAGEYAWGMSIDLNACIGCKACTIACQAENNIPAVGKEQVLRGREMHWIRVDRYFEGNASAPHIYSQPVPCMMCEHAPCELVCPVDATVHDSEGLNVQVYNRCVGTRFCSNNCPYKVRRFNFLQYVDEDEPTLKAQRNPEVTVRRRGVMEKCTYCIQRIEAAHIEADRNGRRIRDGEVITACQAACPTQAIRFGDVADRGTVVAQSKASTRNYSLLEKLNTRPRTSYLARLRNPNPELEKGA